MAARLSMLPEDCISIVLSLTSPPDASRFMLVSSLLWSAAESDIVWDRFLPSDLPRILSRSHTQLNVSSKKELFFQLCGCIPMDGGIRSFSLDKVSGRKCWILSARALSISLSNEPNHWTWTANSTSRFVRIIDVIIFYGCRYLHTKMHICIQNPSLTYAMYRFIRGKMVFFTISRV
ncbi:putative phloem protein [Helianthus debilis subsp. tardiflorus]